ncbi:MAG: hypothetical protein ABSG43_23185 [Solirubrobacteraceae bacterium]|jgi:sugar lactone lactonase YvrE
MRTAILDFYAPERSRPAEPAELEIDREHSRLDAILASDARLERIAGGFVFTEGPVWSREGALLFSSPNTNAIYRWHPSGRVSIFRSTRAATAAWTSVASISPDRTGSRSIHGAGSLFASTGTAA